MSSKCVSSTGLSKSGSIDLSIVSSVSTMSKPPNEGMGCYVNASMIAMFGYYCSGDTWLSKAFTELRKEDTESQRILKKAVHKYTNDLRFSTENGKNAKPNTIRDAISGINPDSHTLLEKETRVHKASSASEFVTYLLESLVRPEDCPFHTQDERIEWNDAHASVVLDRCFCYSDGTELPCTNMTRNILDNISTIPGKYSTTTKQPMSYYSLTLSDASENLSSGLRDFVNYSTVSTIGRPAVDFYVFGKPYRVRGVEIQNTNTDFQPTEQELYQVACDLLPSFQTGSMSQKLIHHIVRCDTIHIHGNSPKKIIEWVASRLFISSNCCTDTWMVVACILVEACILLGDFEQAFAYASRVSKICDKCDYMDFILSKRHVLRDGATGTTFMFPGQIIGSFPKREKPPRWIFTTRTIIVSKSLPYLVLNVTPRKGKLFVPVDDSNTMELSVPVIYGDCVNDTKMKLVGAVEYIPGKSIGHYIGWFWGKLNPHDNDPAWFAYDDLYRHNGYVRHDATNTIKRLSRNGVLFFYVPFCTDTERCIAADDTLTDTYALDKALAEKRINEIARHTRQFVPYDVKVDIDTICEKQKALAYISKNKKLEWCVDVLFGSNTDVLCYDTENPCADIYKKAIHKMTKHWGIEWRHSKNRFVVYDAPTFERMFVNNSNAYKFIGKMLKSLQYNSMHKCTNNKCEMYRNYFRELAVIVSKELLSNPDICVRKNSAFLRSIII